jgi:hypothetical protein
MQLYALCLTLTSPLSHHPIHDLLVHPLASQESLLHASDSPGDILIVFSSKSGGPRMAMIDGPSDSI